jgi:hypothetical protein
MIFHRRPEHEPLPPDRPVIAEPIPLPTPAPPLRTRLGQIMHLNGAVPRGADLRGAVPRRCKTCLGLFIVIGKGSARALYCEECRATKKCPSCNGVGGHYPYCSWVKPRPCRGCGVELGHGGSQSPFCEECRAQQCPECRTLAGRHGAKCLYARRQRRPGLSEYVGVVTEADIVALFETHRAKAVRVAEHICGRVEGEDVVSDVVAWLLEHRDYLQRTPGPAYFFQAVTNNALRRRLYAWARYVVAMDPETLVIVEQMMTRGETSDNVVRLPEPVG